MLEHGYALTGYLIAPIDKPCTSLSCAAKPATSTGIDTASAAAQTLARNRPWLVTKPVRYTGAVCATVADAVGAGHVALLERLAARVADAVLAADERIAAVDLTVRKLRPPVPADLATSGVHIARERG